MKRFCWFCGRQADPDDAFCRDDGQRVVVEDHLSGRLIAERYKLHGVFGGGGFGHVYVAVVELAPAGGGLERGAPVAVKIIERRALDSGAWRKRQLSHEREAKTARSFSHPGLLKVYDAGEEPGGLLYTAMPLGRRDLKTILAGQGPGSEQYSAGRWLALAHGYAAQACGAVAALHAKRVYHRDIKPANLMELDGPGKVALIDYGIARHEEDGTATGTLEGFVSLEYLCPEFFTSADGKVDAALRDQYALGATLYELYTGRPPFTAAEIGAKRNLSEAPRPPRARNPELPQALEELILRALVKKPGERFPDVAAMDAALTRAIESPRPPATAPTAEPEPETAPRPALKLARKPVLKLARKPALKPVTGPTPAPGATGRRWFLAGVLGIATLAAVGNYWERLASEQRWREAAEAASAEESRRAEAAEEARATDRKKAQEARHRAEVEAAEAARVTAGIQWVLIPGGSFMMGSDFGHFANAKLVHRVMINAFEMSKTEVTNKQYRACVEVRACAAPSSYEGGDDHPVVNVDWEQARKFAQWVGGRLPSEAEWEYAARSAGQDWEYPWGNEVATCERAVIIDCGSRTAPVCSRASGNTQQGLCDMSGNVREWVQDAYHVSYEGAPADGSAWENPADNRVIRGGSWGNFALYARADFRGYEVFTHDDRFSGFRLAR